VGLILKALHVSARKKPNVEILKDVAGELEEVAPRLMRIADRDSEAFQAYLDAAKLPKSTFEQSSARSVALEKAAEAAALTAIEARELAKHIIERTSSAEDQVSPVIKADITAGIELLRTLRTVAKENAEANIPNVSDELKRSALSARLDP
jgi:formiminotetrahydrofolate cyclodeaminase